MTDRALESHHAAIDRLVAEWSATATATVAKAVGRAHAHAVVALTDVLRETPQGRRTLRKASQSRSYESAVSDLDALTTALAGPSVASLAGILRDAREAAYRFCLKSWVALAPEGMGIDSDHLSQSRIADVRGLVLHGMELRREVGARADDATRGLLATLDVASRPGMTLSDSADRLRAWRDASTNVITRSAVVAIGDAATAIDLIASIDAARPEFRPTGRHSPGD